MRLCLEQIKCFLDYNDISLQIGASDSNIWATNSFKHCRNMGKKIALTHKVKHKSHRCSKNVCLSAWSLNWSMRPTPSMWACSCSRLLPVKRECFSHHCCLLCACNSGSNAETSDQTFPVCASVWWRRSSQTTAALHSEPQMLQLCTTFRKEHRIVNISNDLLQNWHRRTHKALQKLPLSATRSGTRVMTCHTVWSERRGYK